MEFVAAEASCNVGSLTVLSTHAENDLPKPCTRQDIADLLAECSAATTAAKSAA
jgi:hypothetical protein